MKQYYYLSMTIYGDSGKANCYQAGTRMFNTEREAGGAASLLYQQLKNCGLEDQIIIKILSWSKNE